MDCPVFASKSGERKGELDPYSCPLIYCPPSPDHNLANITYSICVKYIDDVSPNNKTFVKKACGESSMVCTLGCDRMKNYPFSVNITSANETRLLSIGCENGTFAQGSKFPLSEPYKIEYLPDALLKNSSSQLQTTLMIPWALMLVLVFSFIQRKY
ncbi:unnamed protein product [Mucor hiemalis]